MAISSFVTIVSGLPRSGTSMMMRILHQGGMETLTDHAREADQDNLKGYYEYEPVKRTAKDSSWVAGAEGRAVKVIYRFVQYLPSDHEYRVVLMRRNITEVLLSQKKMLQRLNQPGGGLSDEQMARAFMRKMEALEVWIDRQPNMARLDASYNAILAEPAFFCESLNTFLGQGLNVGAMTEAIDRSLYRNRA